MQSGGTQRTGKEGSDVIAGLQEAAGFSRLYESHGGSVRRSLARFGCPPALVHDCMQEVFLRAWKCRGRFRGNCRVGTFLISIARNVAREAIRMSARADPAKAVRQVRFGSSGASLSASAAAELGEIACEVRAAIQQLSSSQRQAIEMVELGGVPPAQAARLVGRSYDSFRSQRRSACRRLRQLLRHLRD